MRVLGIIPARAGSKRLPRKNLQLLGGKPLVARAIEAALGASRLTKILISSDDPEVLAIAATYDRCLALRRPEAISDDQAMAITFVRHALDVMKAGGEPAFDAVAIVQPSSPLTTSFDIDGTIDLLVSCQADSAASVRQLDHSIHPYKFKVLQAGRLLPYFEDEGGRMAAHQLPTLYVRNGAVYVATRAVIETGSILGENCAGFVMPANRSIDINEDIDLALAELLWARSQAH